MRSFKRILGGFLIFLLTAYLLVVLLLPPYLDKKYTPVHQSPPYEVSPEALALYNRLDFPADLHCDALLWRRNLLKRHAYGHVDIPRMLDMRMGLQVFSIVNKVPKELNFEKNGDETDKITMLYFAQGRPPRSWFDLSERVLAQASALHRYAEKSEGKFRVIETRSALIDYLRDRENGQEVTAGLLAVEGGQALEGNMENLNAFYQAGVRMIGLTHFFDNEIGGSAHGVKKGGLSRFGHELIAEMEAKKMLVDLAHASPDLVSDVLDIATRPVVVSHAGVKGTCNNQRNLSDEQLRRIAENGGLVGIAMFEVADCGTDYGATARAIRYAADIMGVEHLSLGSDFDGAIACHTDLTGLPLLVEALLAEGFSEEDIQAIMGGNVRNFLLSWLPD